MEITMEQASQLAEMKLNRMNRDYQNCISSTRVAPQTPLPDSKSAAKDEDDIQEDSTLYTQLSQTQDEDDNDNLDNEEDQNNNTYTTFENDTYNAHYENALPEQDFTISKSSSAPSIAPLTKDTASTIKSIVSSMKIAPPPWVPKTDDGEIDANFDQFVVDRVANWGIEDGNKADFSNWSNEDISASTNKTTTTTTATTTTTNEDDMNDWVATFSDNTTKQKRKKKKKKKKPKTKMKT